MSRFRGWLIAYVEQKGSENALTLAEAAKRAGVRRSVFEDALLRPDLMHADAKAAGLDIELLSLWVEGDPEEEHKRLTIASAASVVRCPPSHRYRGGATELGTFAPHCGEVYRGPHPPPAGEWHAGLERALPTPVYRYQWLERAEYLARYRN